MKKFFVGFLIGVTVGVWGYWYFQRDQTQSNLDQARDSVVQSAEKVKTAIKEAVGEIRPEDIKEELTNTGVVVRQKARQAGAAIADATANARITTVIKTKLFAEPGVSAMSINVDTTDGTVTLSGNVSSADEIAKAVRLSLETEGVHKVISTLQVKPAK